MESLVLSPGLGILGLDSWVWNPGFGFLVWSPGLDSWIWTSGFELLHLDSWLGFLFRFGGLGSLVWSPGTGVLGLDSWVWPPGFKVVGLESLV